MVFFCVCVFALCFRSVPSTYMKYQIIYLTFKHGLYLYVLSIKSLGSQIISEVLTAALSHHAASREASGLSCDGRSCGGNHAVCLRPCRSLGILLVDNSKMGLPRHPPCLHRLLLPCFDLNEPLQWCYVFRNTLLQCFGKYRVAQKERMFFK
jgi:hypothetical protein